MLKADNAQQTITTSPQASGRLVGVI